MDFGTIEFAIKHNELVASLGNLSSLTTNQDDGAIRLGLAPFRGTLGTFVDDGDGMVRGFQYRGAYYRRLDR